MYVIDSTASGYSHIYVHTCIHVFVNVLRDRVLVLTLMLSLMVLFLVLSLMLVRTPCTERLAPSAHLLSLARVAGGPFAMSYVFECYHVAVLVQDLGMRALPGMLLDFCSQSDGADC